MGVVGIEFCANKCGDGEEVMEVFERLLEDSEVCGSGDRGFGFEHGALDKCWGEVIGVLVHFSEAAAAGGVCKRFEGDEFAEDGSPVGGDFKVIEPWAAGLWESGEEDGGDGIFEHAFVEAIGEFLETGGAVDGEWDAGGGGNKGAIGALPVELAAFAVWVEPVIEGDVEGGFEAEKIEYCGEGGGETEASAAVVFGCSSSEVEKGLLAAPEVIDECGH